VVGLASAVLIIAAVVFGLIFLIIKLHEKGYSVDWSYIFDWFRNR
jgi:hypothetical protein